MILLNTLPETSMPDDELVESPHTRFAACHPLHTSESGPVFTPFDEASQIRFLTLCLDVNGTVRLVPCKTMDVM